MSSRIRPERFPGVGEHRVDREAGRLVYPVLSRRSGGLSLGINLFPDAKLCNFDCPYCEVFPIPPGMGPFSAGELEEELESFLERGYSEAWTSYPVRDICISGNGEPTASPHLPEALELCARARRNHPELLGPASLVLITNSTGFLDGAIRDLLARYAAEEGLVPWAKLDGGNERLLRLMAGVDADLERITRGIVEFSRRAPLVIQTMLCEARGYSPSAADLEDYASVLCRLTREGAAIREVHLYTFARPTPGGACSALPDAVLAGYADFVRGRTGLSVRAFGTAAEIAAAEGAAEGAAGARG